MNFLKNTVIILIEIIASVIMAILTDIGFEDFGCYQEFKGEMELKNRCKEEQINFSSVTRSEHCNGFYLCNNLN